MLHSAMPAPPGDGWMHDAKLHGLRFLAWAKGMQARRVGQAGGTHLRTVGASKCH